jgi:hypothetical protein
VAIDVAVRVVVGIAVGVALGVAVDVAVAVAVCVEAGVAVGSEEGVLVGVEVVVGVADGVTIVRASYRHVHELPLLNSVREPVLPGANTVHIYSLFFSEASILRSADTGYGSIRIEPLADCVCLSLLAGHECS